MTRYSRWWICTNVECAVKWDDDEELSCWACGCAAARSDRPCLTSQNGMVMYRP